MLFSTTLPPGTMISDPLCPSPGVFSSVLFLTVIWLPSVTVTPWVMPL